MPGVAIFPTDPGRDTCPRARVAAGGATASGRREPKRPPPDPTAGGSGALQPQLQAPCCPRSPGHPRPGRGGPADLRPRTTAARGRRPGPAATSRAPARSRPLFCSRLAGASWAARPRRSRFHLAPGTQRDCRGRRAEGGGGGAGCCEGGGDREEDSGAAVTRARGSLPAERAGMATSFPRSQAPPRAAAASCAAPGPQGRRAKTVLDLPARCFLLLRELP